MNTIFRRPTIVLAAACLLAGCAGGNKHGDGSSTPTPQSASKQSPAGPAVGTLAYDQSVFHALLADHTKIRREVTFRPDGAETLTESDDPVVAARLIDHVTAMKGRIHTGRRLRQWDPLYVALFDNADKIDLTVTPTAKGVRVIEISKDAHVAEMLKAHARAVSGFAAEGFAEAQRSHPVPAAPSVSPAPKPSLSSASEPTAPVVQVPIAAGNGNPRDVSVLLDVSHLKVAAITLRRGTVLPVHTAPVPVTIHVLEGTGVIHVTGKPVPVQRGTLISLTANEEHDVVPAPGSDMVVLVHYLRGGQAAAPVPASTPPAEHRAITTDKLEPFECGTISNLHTLGGVFLASQPKPDDFAQAKKGGVKTVINLRHASENKEFDEKTVVEAEGLAYINIPWNGSDELTDAIFDQSREQLKTASRPILLHCSSANRVGAVWLSYRVLDGGLSWDEALAEAKTVGLKSADFQAKAKDYIQRHTR